jgi:hypothetical protein
MKAKNTRRDPRVALSILDFTNPYEEVQIRGRVVERRPDSDFKMMDPISHKYTGKPFPFRSPEGRVALVIESGKSSLYQAAVRAYPGDLGVRIQGPALRRRPMNQASLRVVTIAGTEVTLAIRLRSLESVHVHRLPTAACLWRIS